jgi:hypothetical protein
MDPFGSRVLPALSGSPRVTKPLIRTGAALDKLYRLPAGDVHRGKQDEPVSASCGICRTSRMHQKTLSSVNPYPLHSDRYIGRLDFGSLATTR